MENTNKNVAIVIICIALIGIFLYMRCLYIISYVESESMEPTYCKGDIVIIKKVPPSQISIGDVIVFKEPPPGNKLILHRVAYIEEKDGKLYFVTKGDNNPNIDRWVWVPEDYVLGKLVGRVPYLGYFFLSLDEPGARLMFILIVILTFMIYWSMSSEKERRVYPLSTHLRAINIRVLVVLILVCSFLVIMIRSRGDPSNIYVEIIKPINSGVIDDKTYMIVNLSVVSRCSPYESVKRVEINVTIDGGVVGYGVWEIAYPFYGEKNVSIAIVLNSLLSLENVNGRVIIYIKVLVKNYITGRHKYLEFQPQTLRMVVLEQ